MIRRSGRDKGSLIDDFIGNAAVTWRSSPAGGIVFRRALDSDDDLHRVPITQSSCELKMEGLHYETENAPPKRGRKGLVRNRTTGAVDYCKTNDLLLPERAKRRGLE
jgi:hypothetical protein